jgi:uncharacterized protein YhaN
LVPTDAVTTEEFIWAAPIWQQMKEYQSKSGDLISQLEGQSLDADKQELLTKAKQHYEWFNFLDAYRLASAAAS